MSIGKNSGKLRVITSDSKNVKIRNEIPIAFMREDIHIPHIISQVKKSFTYSFGITGKQM